MIAFYVIRVYPTNNPPNIIVWRGFAASQAEALEKARTYANQIRNQKGTKS